MYGCSAQAYPAVLTNYSLSFWSGRILHARRLER